MLNRRNALSLLSAIPLSGWAQATFPSKPVRIIVPFPAGGGVDVIARHVAAKLADLWKVAVVVENKAGGNQIIGVQAAVASPPDGHTLLLALDAALTMNPSLYAQLPYSPLRDLVPITLAASTPLVLAVHPDTRFKSAGDLLNRPGGKTEPSDTLSFAYGATPVLVAYQMIRSRTGIAMQPVQYRGAAPAVADVVAGHVPVLLDALGPALPHIRSGKLRPLAITASARSPLLPDVPTLAEVGLPQFDFISWMGFLAVAGTPRSILDQVHRDLVSVLTSVGTSERFANFGMVPVSASPDEFRRRILAEGEVYGQIIKQHGIVLSEGK